MKKKELLIQSIEALVVGLLIIAAAWYAKQHTQKGATPTPTPTVVVVSETPTLTPTIEEKPTETPTPVPDTPTPTIVTPTPTTEIPLEATERPKKATPTPQPSKTPSPNSQVASSGKKEVGKGHTFKPYTRHTAYNVPSSQQYKLQKIASTSEEGIRIVQDPDGEWRYCIALGTYWAGGHPQHIGRCIDVYMYNGSVLKCVLADVKKQEHTVNQQNKFGGTNKEILEFIVDDKKISYAVKNSGNVSNAGPQFKGDVEYMIVYDRWIEGFGK